MNTPRITRAFAALSVLSTSAWAQWSDDSTTHVTVADGNGEQVQPKVVPDPFGGAYVSWYTSDAGYDVRLQRIDQDGNPAWGPNGILIADRSYSSTQDYDLDIDLDGFAVLVFRDDRFGGDRITAQRVAPNGNVQWGPNGIQFSDGTAFVASPDVASTTDGCSVIAWSSDNVTKLAKISADGMIEWETEISEPGQTTLVASMHSAGNGRVVLSWVQYVFFLGQKTLHAAMINPDGTERWASRANVYDGGSLQFGYFPEFVTTLGGTSIFSWYDTQNGLNVYTQVLEADGSERFPHNGVAVSAAPRERVSPSVTYDQSNLTTFVSWVELANNQGSQGVYAQAIDSSGNRLWSDSGVEISTIDANESGSINTQVIDNNLVTLWIESTGGFGSDVIESTRLNNDGTEAWSTTVASNPAYRARLNTTRTQDDMIIGAWQIGDFGVADIEAHNLNPDGTIGIAYVCAADLNADGSLNFFDVSMFLNAFNAMDPIADFVYDGVFNFFDVSAFLQAYNSGCP